MLKLIRKYLETSIKKMDEQEKTELTENGFYQIKDAEFHSQAYNAWFQTRMETDKSILMISAGGIGLQISLFTSVIDKSNLTSLAFFIMITSSVFYLISIVLTLKILSENSDHIEAVINNKDPKKLSHLDVLSKTFMIVGIVFSFIFAVYIGYDSLSTDKNTIINSMECKEEIMSQEKQGRIIKDQYREDSVDSVLKIKPTAPVSNKTENTEKKSNEQK